MGSHRGLSLVTHPASGRTDVNQGHRGQRTKPIWPQSRGRNQVAWRGHWLIKRAGHYNYTPYIYRNPSCHISLQTEPNFWPVSVG